MNKAKYLIHKYIKLNTKDNCSQKELINRDTRDIFIKFS